MLEQQENVGGGLKSRILIVWAVVLVILVLAGLYIFLNPDRTPSSSEPVSAVSVTANRLNTFENKNFALLYPDSILVKESEDEKEAAFSLKEDSQPGLFFTIHENPDDLSTKEYFKDRGDLYAGTEPKDIIPIVVGGKEGVRFTPYVTEAGGDIYIIPLKYSFLEIFDRKPSSFAPDVLSQMLSSLRFK